MERLWPRGLKKEELALDLWLKEIAPSPELRQWFGHDPAKWEEFCRRYWAELAEPAGRGQAPPGETASRGRVTLVYGSKDEAHNAAVALKKFLEPWEADGRGEPIRIPPREALSCNGWLVGAFRPGAYFYRRVRLRRTTHADNIQRFSGRG